MSQFHESAFDTLALSSPAKSHLRKLVEELQKRLGDTFLSLCVYGSAARGEWQELTSDINIFLLLQEVHFEHLDSIGDTMAKVRKRARIVPLLVTPDELRRASDVYCIKFDDISRHHVCIFGEDPFSELLIDDAHIRFVCEFELRNLAMRMRQFFLQSYGKKNLEQQLLMRFFTSSLFPLRALCGLLELERPTDTPDAIEVIGQALDSEVKVLERLHEIHEKAETILPAECNRLYERFNQLILLAVERVDALEEVNISS